MSEQHTKEPWGMTTHPCQYMRLPAIKPHYRLHERDYRRAIACVNACAELNPEGITNLVLACEYAYGLARGAATHKEHLTQAERKIMWGNVAKTMKNALLGAGCPEPFAPRKGAT